MFDYTKIIDAVPDYKVFLTVDEMDASSRKLAADYPDLCSVSVAGHSRAGHEILLLKIGSGAKNAFLFGCPHPNEPIGAMTVEYFSKALCENPDFLKETGYTWYIIKSIDVDGTKLNENWFKGPFTLTNYAKNYFRPAGYQQAEWTFPIDYKKYSFHASIPETEVLMKCIEEIKPAFMYSLHNAGFGGTYWYLSKAFPDAWPLLYKASEKQSVPLHLGEPEINYITPFSKAIYPMITLRQQYDYQEQFGDIKTMRGGDSSCGYAETLGLDTVTLVTEMPYFTEPRIQSDKVMPYTRREVALKALDERKKERDQVSELYASIKEFVTSDNPFAKFIWMMVEHGDTHYETQKKFIESSNDYSQPCKESEAFDNIEAPKSSRLFTWGMLVRCCTYELDKNPDETAALALKKVQSAASENFDSRAKIAEADLNYDVISIQRLVRVQLESGLIIAGRI
ncbi:MAG: hypothetical protein LBR25_07070 [Erysipelotrichaceae bacterium]|nr:hypothetical protein [Erysipelotrichaceae bacterium]